jgi:hypothetical protein
VSSNINWIIKNLKPGKYYWSVQAIDNSYLGGSFAETNSFSICDIAAASAISGTTTVCQRQNDVVYTVPAITNATTYLWILPAGATGNSTTNSISVNWGTSAVSGNISVKGSNGCGDGAASILAVTVNVKPVTPVVTVNANILHSNTSNGNNGIKAIR